MMRFAIRISPLWRPILFLFGGTAGRSFAEIEGGELRVRFGFLFDHRFPLEQVESVGPSRWPLWGGVGWRANFLGKVGLIGSYGNIVEVRFRERQRVRMLLPLSCRLLYLSLAEPHAFVAALHEAMPVR